MFSTQQGRQRIKKRSLQYNLFVVQANTGITGAQEEPVFSNALDELPLVYPSQVNRAEQRAASSNDCPVSVDNHSEATMRALAPGLLNAGRSLGEKYEHRGAKPTPRIDPNNTDVRPHSSSISNSPIASMIDEWIKPCLLDIGRKLPTAVILFSLIPPALADSGDDFANNLFTDLAPILALFGEQVTKQFLSESSGWADCVLFAMAPMGIITALVSAIRVAGNPLLKTIVGRGKEGRAQAELELMSSTSPDVGEMWNGDAIVRVFGTPSMFQVIYAPDKVISNPMENIHVLSQGNPLLKQDGKRSILLLESLETGAKRLLGHIRSKLGFLPGSIRKPIYLPLMNLHVLEDNEFRALIETRHSEDPENLQGHETDDGASPPNIALNARGEPISNFEKIFMAILGIAIQSLVLVFWGFITYHREWNNKFKKNGYSPPTGYFLCALVGTVSINLGMLICAYIIDCASTEQTWSSLSFGQNFQVAWIQKGETVNDQVFEPYIILGHLGQKTIRTSRRCSKQLLGRLQSWVVLGTLTSITGFIIQFIGLRGMNWSATIAQLAATILMTAIRFFTRRRTIREPEIAETLDGRELDSMARKICDCRGWKVVGSQEGQQVTDDGLAQTVLLARRRLQDLSQWHADIEATALALCSAMKQTMTNIKFKDDMPNTLLWKLRVLSFAPNSKDGAIGELPFQLTRRNAWDPWELSPDLESEMIASISLWMLHFKEDEKYYQHLASAGGMDCLPGRQMFASTLVWPTQAVYQETLRQWIGSDILRLWVGDPNDGLRKHGVPRYRLTGGTQIQGSLADSVTVATFINTRKLEIHLAQFIFSEFFSALTPFIEHIPEPSMAHRDDLGNIQRVQNDTINSLATEISKTGLGTPLEVLVCIIPHLGRHQKLPDLLYIPGLPVSRSDLMCCLRDFRRSRRWHKVSSLIQQFMVDEKSVGIAFPDARGFESWQMATRFCKMILALISKPILNDNINTKDLFFHWLGTIPISEIPFLLETSLPPPVTLRLRISHLADLTPDMVEKVEKLLAPFAPVLELVLEPSGETELLEKALSSSNVEELMSVLDEALKSGHDAVIEALVDRGIDIYHLKDRSPTETPLAIAAAKGHDSVIRVILAQLEVDFPDIYSTASYLSRPLWQAVHSGDSAAVDLLLHHTGPATPKKILEAALTIAAAKGYGSIVDRLLDSGACANGGEQSGGYRRILFVIRNDTEWEEIEWEEGRSSFGTGPGELHVVKLGEPGEYQKQMAYMFEKGDIGSLEGLILIRTPLQAAAEGGHLAVLEKLLIEGAKVNRKFLGAFWWTALQTAARLGHLEILDRLLKEGANVNEVPAAWSRQTALQSAASGGYIQAVDRLLNEGADVNAPAAPYWGRTALQGAAEGDFLEVMNRLLEAGADVNAPPASTEGREALEDNDNAHLAFTGGRTALEAAADKGHLRIVERLIEEGVDVNQGVNYRRTALAAAAGRGHLHIVNTLLEAGALYNETRVSGQTPLQVAARGGYLEIVNRLLEVGADFRAQPAKNGGRTALQAAAEGGHLTVVNHLLAVGADVNAAPAAVSGVTALQGAAGGGHLDVLNLLLAARALVNGKTSKQSGRTALQAAAGGGHLHVVDQLLNAGADVNTAPAWYRGMTSLQAAAGGGHLDVVDRLLETGAHVNAARARSGGMTALQAAAGGGHLHVVDRLLDAGADVNSPAGHRGMTALQAAAGGGHLHVVDRLLDAGADVNAVPVEYGEMTALQAAAGGGHLHVVDRLLDAGADVNAAPSESGGRTALQAAAGGGHLDVVDRLLDAGANVNAAPSEFRGRTALQAAAGGGHLDVVDRLLDAGAHVNAAPSKSGGRTALQAAAGGGDLHVVDRLLDAGADVNSPAGHRGMTALQTAAGGGHLHVVDRLLDAGADVNAAPSESGGRTALQAAAGGGHLHVVDRLLDAGAHVNAAPAEYGGMTSLRAAAGGGYLHVVDRLLDAGADVNTAPEGYREMTSLQAAAGGGHLDVVDRLLDAGADVNAVPSESDGRTALQAAAGGGHLHVVDRLLNAGANVNAAPAKYGGMTSLPAAAGGGHLDVVDRLLNAGENVNTTPAYQRGMTALQAAAGGGHLDVVDRLLDAGAEVNAPAQYAGRTALQAAAGAGYPDVVNILLENGAEINAKPAYSHGRTALQTAAEEGDPDMVERLLDQGADVNAPPSNRWGVTALQAAEKGGHQEIVEILLQAGAGRGKISTIIRLWLPFW